jgi:hypothetical protein
MDEMTMLGIFSITWPGGAEHAMKSAAAILSNFYKVKQQ